MRIEIFQSYQGSILSEDKITNGIGKIPLSILSRFYFIWMSMMYWGVVVGLSILSRFYFINSKLTILGPYIDLSILSRFYFIYARRDNPASELFLSILSRFYFICGYLWKLNYLRLSFNPIKVLFYQVKQTVKVIEPKRLSILSRFYFINKRITEEEKNAKLSILSRFYFIGFDLDLLMTIDMTFNPIKVLFYHGSGDWYFRYQIAFNPIKVLFYQLRDLSFCRDESAFNPIKVLFYHGELRLSIA